MSALQYIRNRHFITIFNWLCQLYFNVKKKTKQNKKKKKTKKKKNRKKKNKKNCVPSCKSKCENDRSIW